MKESGASVMELRAAGYTAARLKQLQAYSALALMDGGFTTTGVNARVCFRPLEALPLLSQRTHSGSPPATRPRRHGEGRL